VQAILTKIAPEPERPLLPPLRHYAPPCAGSNSLPAESGELGSAATIGKGDTSVKLVEIRD
jgi:hypothetical protein